MRQWPNFFVVGAPKAGTSSLYAYLKQTDGIYMPSFKEPHYFSPIIADLINFDRIKDEKKYLDLFKNVKNETIIGEASASYLRDPKSPRLIYETIPNAKIIISLRNPIDRAFSHHLMNWGIGHIKLSFSEAIRKYTKSDQRNSLYNYSIIEPGFYYESVKRYLEIFGTKQIKIIFFNDLIKDTRKTVKEILEFLDITSEPPANIDRVYNAYREPKNKMALFLIQNRIIRKIGKKIFPQTTSWVLIRKFFLRKGQRPKLSEEDALFLKEIYALDTQKLEKLLGRKLPWSDSLTPKNNFR